MIYTIRGQSTVWMLLAIWKRDINCNVDRFVFKEFLVNAASILAHAYPLYLIIKNIKKALTHDCNRLLLQQTAQTEKNIFPIITPFSNMSKLLTAITHCNWHHIENDTTPSTIWPSKLLSAYTKSGIIHSYLISYA